MDGVLDDDLYICWARKFTERLMSMLARSSYASWICMKRFDQVVGDFCFKQVLEDALVCTLQEGRI